MKKLDIMIANPSGNITIFVLTPIDISDYKKVASLLLAKNELVGEQVAFIKSLPVNSLSANSSPAKDTPAGEMQMCGLEFCGNASSAFGLICSKHAGTIGSDTVSVRVSGCDHPLEVEVNTMTNHTKIQMPLPLDIKKVDLSSLNLHAYIPATNITAVDMDGIIHVVLEDVAPDRTIFDKIKNEINRLFHPPAMGVLFYDTAKHFMTPVVYVKDVDTVYFEGSCGSGTTAISAYFSLNKPDGIYSYSLAQPAGTIDSAVEVRDQQIRQITIEGPVTLSDVLQVSIDL